MSDTTTTITPDKRAFFRDLTSRGQASPKNMRRVLDALEAAEARAEKAEDYAEKLVYAVTDGNLSNSYDVQVVADEVSRIWQSYTNQKVAAVRAEAEAERDRLRAELETARQVAASAQSVAEAAWGGEIPSPLPGHKHMTEDDLAAMDAPLDCPLCGGSGHIGDCDATAASEVKRLRAERHWLANRKQLGRPCAWADCPFGNGSQVEDENGECPRTLQECWKESARRAVAESEVRE